jgi:hypothetical protein
MTDAPHYRIFTCRLLLAVCEHWSLWPAVSSRLDDFLQSPKGRTKAAAPNLGLLLPLLACSPARHGWAVMSGPLLQEAMDRKVLWMCKKDPSLVQVSIASSCTTRNISSQHQLQLLCSISTALHQWW